jgi:hypothetical protein
VGRPAQGDGQRGVEARYARGEIGRDEYLQNKNDILNSEPGA